MAKGGLLNQVPQVDLPTTMDCNVVSIGGQTPEEYANLIAQKVFGLSNPGEYGSGTIKGNISVGESVYFDGIKWKIAYIDSNGDIYLYLDDETKYRVVRYNNTVNSLKNLYLDSNLRQEIKKFEETLSNTAKNVLKEPRDIYCINDSGTGGEFYVKITDKVWNICLCNVVGTQQSNYGNLAKEYVNNRLSGINYLKFDYFTHNYKKESWFSDIYSNQGSFKAFVGLDANNLSELIFTSDVPYMIPCICLNKNKLP